MTENKIPECLTTKSNFVHKELLERALTAWLQDARDTNKVNDNESTSALEIDEDYLHTLFANEFPALSF